MTGAPLGIIAGGGQLPLKVAGAARSAGRPVYVIVLEGFGNPADFQAWPHIVCRIGAAGRMLEWFREHGVKQLVLSGKVKRPSFLTLRPDAGAVKLAARVSKRAFGGDDEILATVMAVLREEGFDPIGGQEIMRSLLTPAGLLTKAMPTLQALKDIARGIRVVRALGAVDVGQGAVVQQGMVLGVEAIEGTDALLARTAALHREGPRGVFIKLVKPGQDLRIDLPTIGPDTIRSVIAAGLAGLAIEADGCIILDRDEVVSMADAAGIFLLALHPDSFLAQHPENPEGVSP
ncbi:UDP-2,3-diacylglucosamine diphosphatase LpxI [Acetobacteraceae bacterium H6797]|nr:UDP-2,3-diacylglucosamine diphosphatase LpxI [Acetobacteraceae bacterium H6797]